MFTNVALDVFIGIAFVFLLYSLLATILMEVIASFFNLRGALLVKAIRVMLEDRTAPEIKSKTIIGRYIEGRFTRLQDAYAHIRCILPDNTLAKAFYKHPSVKYLSSSVERAKPSYIEPARFSTTLVRILRGRGFDGTLTPMQAIHRTLHSVDPATGGLASSATVEVGVQEVFQAVIQPETLDHLRQLFIDAGNDINRFEALLEDWFNETMARANGWYKRNTRNILFAVGFIIAVAGNVDTIKIFRVLSKDKSAREQLVQLAIQSQAALTPAMQELKDSGRLAPKSGATPFDLGADSMLRQTYTMLRSDAESAGSVLGMGWHKSNEWKQLTALQGALAASEKALASDRKNRLLLEKTAALKSAVKGMEPRVPDKFDWSTSLLGWIITGLALTLGAPFWFDLLNKMISIRSTGTRPVLAPATGKDTGEAAAPAASISTIGSGAPAPAANTASGHVQPEFVADEAFNQKIAQG